MNLKLPFSISFLLVLFLDVSTVTAQTEKKSSYEWRYAYNEARVKQLSLEQDVVKTQDHFLSEIDRITIMYSERILLQLEQYSNCKRGVENMSNQLIQLGENPERFINVQRFDTSVVEGHMTPFLRIFDGVDFKIKPEIVEITADPQEMPKKELKKFVPDAIERFSKANEINQKKINTINNQESRLLQYEKELKLLWEENQLIINELDDARTTLRNRLNQFEKEYNSKGAKNLPPVYEEIFGQEILVQDELVAVPYETKEPKIEKEPDIWQVVDEPATFPGGVEALTKYLRDNISVPDGVMKDNISGKCYVRFVISASGEVSNVQLVKGIKDCPECGTEAVRVTEKMPSWIPGKNKGKAVNTWFNLPIKFSAQ